MINWIKEFFTPPTFLDEDKTRVARLLYVVSEIGLAGAVIHIFVLTFITRDYGTRLIGTSIALPLLFFEMALVKKGYVRTAAFFVVMATWIGGNYITIYTGGVRDVGFGINLIVVLEAGMLISLGAGLVFGALSSLVGLGMAIAQTHGLLPPLTASQVTAWSAWSTQSIYLGLMAGLLYISVNYIQQSLARTKRAEARLRGIIENTPDIIFETDRAGIITLINRYQDLYLGKQVRELIHAADIPNVNRAIELAFTTGETSSLEVQSYSPDGTPTWYSVRVGPIAQEGKVTSLVVVITDITERKQAETERENLIAELETRNAELERFTYTVSHDLKSPLVTIRGFLGFVEKDALAGNVERIKADVSRIIEATDRMQRLLANLLDLSRIGRMMNPPQVVPFETIVHEALELVQERIQGRGVQVVIAPDLPTVYGDRARLVEVVQNLVDNACKFMGDQPKPRIEIGVSSADAEGRPILFVRDNGTGIEPQYHERVFGLFSKLDAQSEGTGVGLALVKRIVEVHGGRIWIESAGLGRGSTFCFTLPVANQAATLTSRQMDTKDSA